MLHEGDDYRDMAREPDFLIDHQPDGPIPYEHSAAAAGGLDDVWSNLIKAHPESEYDNDILIPYDDSDEFGEMLASELRCSYSEARQIMYEEDVPTHFMDNNEEWLNLSYILRNKWDRVLSREEAEDIVDNLGDNNACFLGDIQ